MATGQGSGYTPLPQLCNTNRVWASLCMDAPSAIPECTIIEAQAQAAGASFSSCLTGAAFSLPGTSQIISDIRQMCSEPGMSDMNGCSDCPTAQTCQDPLTTISRVCLDMEMTQCASWRAFCNSDAAVDGNVNVAAPGLCLLDYLRAEAAEQYPPPRATPSSPCISSPQTASCATYRLPDAEATAALQQLCASSAQLPACSIWSACNSGDVSGNICAPFGLMAAVCEASPQAMACRTHQSLCGTTGSVVQQCNQMEPTVRSAMLMPSIRTSLESACWATSGPSSPVNCYRCSSSATCVDPFSALSLVCGGSSDGATCAAMQSWCSGGGLTAAPWYCSPDMYTLRSTLIAGLLGGSPAPTASPSPSPAIAPSPSPSPSPSPTVPSPSTSPSPSPVSSNCLRTPTAAFCASYSYPDSAARQDIAALCRSMPAMTGCSIWNSCQAGAGASGIFCSPFNVLATICTDMPTMTACASYLSLCNTRNTTVRQCRDESGIPSAMTSTGVMDQVISICTEMSMVDCAQCVAPYNTAACPDPFFTLSSLCMVMPTMIQCDPYFNMCAAAVNLARTNQAATNNTSTLTRYCNSNFNYVPGAPPPVLLQRTYLPAMLNYFHQRTSEVLLWTEWVPETGGQYAGAVIAIITMGLFSVILKSVRSALSLWWSYEESLRLAGDGAQIGMHPQSTQAPATLGVNLTNGNGELGHGAITTAAPGHVGLRIMTDMEVHVTGRWWWLCTGRQLWQSAVKSLLFGMSITLDYFNMLVAMTFNIGFFVAVVGGYLIGSFLCTPILENYSARLQQRKNAQRSLLPTFHATLLAADAAAAKDARSLVHESSSPDGSTPPNPGFVMVQQDGSGECCCGEPENPACCP